MASDQSDPLPHMTYQEAAEILGMHYVSIIRLKRLKKLRPTADGGVDDKDVYRYLNSRTKPPGFLEGYEAARELSIPVRAISLIARNRKLKAGLMPRPGGGWWVREATVAQLKKEPSVLASLGIRMSPPAGWVTREQAAKLIGHSRSWVTRLGTRGTIRRRRISRHNTWYSREDLEKYVVA